MSIINAKLPPDRRGDPTWATALDYPRQGYWTEEAYFSLERQGNQLLELSNGYLERLPMPYAFHQRILRYLFLALDAHLQSNSIGGELFFAPLPTRIFPGTIREPDLLYLSPKRSEETEKYPIGADFVLEVVSGGHEGRKRDLVTKRREYAQAGIKEYWIVDPKKSVIHVLTLERSSKKYKLHGKFTAGQTASSKMFKGFTVPVNEVFKKR